MREERIREREQPSSEGKERSKATWGKDEKQGSGSDQWSPMPYLMLVDQIRHKNYENLRGETKGTRIEKWNKKEEWTLIFGVGWSPLK